MAKIRSDVIARNRYVCVTKLLNFLAPSFTFRQFKGLSVATVIHIFSIYPRPYYLDLVITALTLIKMPNWGSHDNTNWTIQLPTWTLIGTARTNPDIPKHYDETVVQTSKYRIPQNLYLISNVNSGRYCHRMSFRVHFAFSLSKKGLSTLTRAKSSKVVQPRSN